MPKREWWSGWLMLVALGAVVVLAGCRPAENPLQGNATNSAIPAPPKPATNAASPAATNSAPEWMASVDEVNRAIDARNWDDASARIANAEKLVPAEHRGVFIVPQFKILLGKKEYAAAYEFAARISAAQPQNALLQNELAWQVASVPNLEQRDLALAEVCALRAQAAAVTNSNNLIRVGVLDTLARVKFMRGKKTEALAAQEEAIKLAEGDLKTAMQEELESYQRGELPKGK